MEFKPQLTIRNQIFDYVDVQREGSSAIYKNQTSFLRIGELKRIQRDLALHKQMEKIGFPVAKLLDEGDLDGMYFFIEESLGNQHYGLIFKDETKESGKISDATFNQFVDLSTRFAEAQLKTATATKNWQDFERGIHLDILQAELPTEKERILSKFKTVQERLSIFPFVLTHGDFTPFNMCPKGIIDLEDSFMGPAGFDLGALIEHLNWFPESTDYEFYRLYNFTPAQKKMFLDRIDDVYLKAGLPKMSDYLADFNFARGVWFSVRMNHTPKLQQFRYSEIRKLLV